MNAHEPAEGHRILDQIVSEALADDGFRQKLFAHPKAVLRERGLHVPDELEVVVHQNTSDHVHLVLPTLPKGQQKLNPEEKNVRRLSDFLHF